MILRIFRYLRFWLSGETDHRDVGIDNPLPVSVYPPMPGMGGNTIPIFTGSVAVPDATTGQDVGSETPTEGMGALVVTTRSDRDVTVRALWGDDQGELLACSQWTVLAGAGEGEGRAAGLDVLGSSVQIEVDNTSGMAATVEFNAFLAPESVGGSFVEFRFPATESGTSSSVDVDDTAGGTVIFPANPSRNECSLVNNGTNPMWVGIGGGTVSPGDTALGDGGQLVEPKGSWESGNFYKGEVRAICKTGFPTVAGRQEV